MKTRIITTLLTAVFLVAATLPANAQSTEQLFQKGIMKEEGEGNLPEAIEIFNSIVEDSEADDALQAKALLHVGLCYEKLGKNEASRAYQKLVNNFPAQKNEVAIARERLSRLILAAEKLAQKDEQEKTYALTNRKVWDESDTYLTGHISPDGKYLSYVDWDTGDLALYEINTGKKRRLTNKGTWEESDAYAEYSVWLPDSKQIVYLWVNKERQAEIRTIKIGDTTPRTLFTNEGMNWAEIYDCSPDGKNVLLCFNRKDNNGELVTISTIDGSKETLRLFKSNWTHSAAFSPDGRFIVYDLPQENEAGNKDIYIMNLGTKNESVLINHPEDDRVMGWLPDRNDLLFISDRTGTPDFWRIKVEHGKSVGTAELVKSNKGPFPPLSLGFTDNGIFYYGERRNRVDVYEMEIDPLSGNIIEHPYKIVEKYIGCNGTPDYSEDGKFLAYVSRRPPGTMRFTTNPVGNVLCIRSLETGIEKEFRPDLNVFGFPKWAPDGQSVMVVNFDQKGNLEYYQIDTNTGKAKPVLLNTGRNLFGGHYFSDNGEILYHGIQDEITKKYKLVARDLKKNTEIVLYEDDNHFTLAVSPDKQSIAILSEVDKSLKILPVKGGEPKELFNSEQAKDLRPETRSNMFTWSSDGKSIYFADQLSNEEGYGCQLYRISVKSGNITNLGLKSEGYFMSLNAHPDGRHFVYSAKGKSNSEVWMMENFLPPEKLAENNAPEKEPQGIRIRQVSKKSYLDDLGTVSSDGRYMSCVDWGEGDLAILDLKSDEKKVLTNKANLEDNPQKFVIGSAISKNGNLIAYSWWKPYHTWDLHIFDVKRNISKKLYEKESVEVYPLTWISDDNLIVLRQDRKKVKTYLTSFNITDGTHHDLKTFNQRTWLEVSACPDGKYIAYDKVNQDNGKSDIYLLSLDGQTVIPLITHPSNDQVIGWIPGQNDFLFVSDRAGTWDLWTIPLKDYKPQGESKKVYTNIGRVSPVGITDKAKCFVGFSKQSFHSYITNYSTLTDKPEKDETIPFPGTNLQLRWSPDGKFLAYIEEEDREWKLMLKDLEKGTTNPAEDELSMANHPRWSPDGKKILVFGRHKDIPRSETYNGGFNIIDVNTGKVNEIALLLDFDFTPSDDDALPVSGHEWSQDGKNIFLLFHNDGIINYDLETGKKKTICKRSDFERGIFDISPDRKNLLFALNNREEKKSRLFAIPVSGEKEKEICTVKDVEINGTAFWSPDGKHVYFTSLDDGNTDLFRVPADGGIPEKVWHMDKTTEMLSVHPSGKQIAYSVRERTTQIRVIENMKQEIEKIYAEKE